MMRLFFNDKAWKWLPPETIIAFLESEGYTQTDSHNNFTIHRDATGNINSEIYVPTKVEFKDYAWRVEELVEWTAERKKRSAFWQLYHMFKFAIEIKNGQPCEDTKDVLDAMAECIL